MNDRIKDKITEIEKFLDDLGSFLPSEFEEYQENLQNKAACERYFEKIVEAVVDLAFMVLKELKENIPEEDNEAFAILERKDIISILLSKKLQNAKSMRNILAHEYGIVDDRIVFLVVTEEIERDIQEFLKSIENYLQKKEKVKEK